jgi:hypothetical protein
VVDIREYRETATHIPWILPAEFAHPRSATGKFGPESSGHPVNARNSWSNARASLWLNFSDAGDFLGDIDHIVPLLPDARRLGGDEPSIVPQGFRVHFSPLLFD